MAKKDNAFEAEVLTRLEYIKEKQETHDKNIGKIFDRFEEVRKDSSQVKDDFNKRFDVIEKDVHVAKTTAKILGGGGGIAGFISLIWRFIR